MTQGKKKLTNSLQRVLMSKTFLRHFANVSGLLWKHSKSHFAWMLRDLLSVILQTRTRSECITRHWSIKCSIEHFQMQASISLCFCQRNSWNTRKWAFSTFRSLKKFRAFSWVRSSTFWSLLKWKCFQLLFCRNAGFDRSSQTRSGR